MRRWRDRVSPEAAGLPVGGQRRAAGLRREELAQLARISVDYVTRLEQGRATNPSEQVVEALVRALRVSGTEREHLMIYARHRGRRTACPPRRPRCPDARRIRSHRYAD